MWKLAMAQTPEGAKKARETMIRKAGGVEAYREAQRLRGALGGAAEHVGPVGFANPEIGPDGLTGPQRAKKLAKTNWKKKKEIKNDRNAIHP